MKKVLAIAGTDCTGGAGIQADIKTITVHKMYAMSVITAVVAQNTTGVYDIEEITPKSIEKQIECVFEDIRPDAVKIGMVSSSKIIEVIAYMLKKYNANNIVVDPVMVSTSGNKLLCDEAMDALKEKLIPIGDIITPNIPEAQELCGFSIKSEEEMIKAAINISKNIKGAVLIKGGHFNDRADDLLYKNNEPIWYRAERINTQNTHGTGCTLSSAIACGLAQNGDIELSVKNAKEYVRGAMLTGLNLGKGRGPLEHTYKINI